MEYGINKKNQVYYPENYINSSKKEISRKRQKGHRRKSPQGGWGMGSKEPIPKMTLFIIGYRISELKLSENSWSLYRLKPIFYNFGKNLSF